MESCVGWPRDRGSPTLLGGGFPEIVDGGGRDPVRGEGMMGLVLVELLSGWSSSRFRSRLVFFLVEMVGYVSFSLVLVRGEGRLG